MIVYAVNRFTKEHRRADTIAWQCKYSMDWLIVEADADGWIDHDGGECPLPLDQPVECKDKHGAVMKFRAAGSVIGWIKAVKQYRPILEPQADQPKEWRGPEPGERARTSGGDCIVLAIDIERGKASVQWHDGELGVVNVECMKPPTTHRERWVDRASAVEYCMPDGYQPRELLEALYDTGLAHLPEDV